MRSRIHRTIYILLLCLLVIFMTTSVFMTNLVWVLLLANWVLEWNWREKFTDFRHNYLLQAFLVLLGVHLVWLIGTENYIYALYDLQKKMPLFLLPLVILTTPPPTPKEAMNIGICYVGTVLVVTGMGLVRYLTIADLPYRDIVPHISHIRFGLNLCLSLFALVWAALKYRRPWLYCLNLLLSLWFLAFLLMIHSYTAFIIIIVTALVLLIAYRNRMEKPLRIAAYAIVGGILMLSLGLCGYYCYDYYHLRPLSTEPLAKTTANGRPYMHLKDSLIENGNYVHNYICEEEMRQEWAKRSTFPFDSVTSSGWSIYPTLLRYLNGLNLTKDSIGVTHLTAEDISAIEKGIANPVYIQPGPRKMVYVMCYEYENYHYYHRVKDFSMLQRLELWGNGVKVFLQHPWMGVGTGDVVDVCQARLNQTHSALAHKDMHTHNQYLNFLLAFGLIGFAIIVFFFARAVILSGSCHRILFTTFLCILLISFVSEDTLETLAGIVFTALFFSLLSIQKSNTGTALPNEKHSSALLEKSSELSTQN